MPKLEKNKKLKDDIEINKDIENDIYLSILLRIGIKKIHLDFECCAYTNFATSANMTIIILSYYLKKVYTFCSKKLNCYYLHPRIKMFKDFFIFLSLLCHAICTCLAHPNSVTVTSN